MYPLPSIRILEYQNIHITLLAAWATRRRPMARDFTLHFSLFSQRSPRPSCNTIIHTMEGIHIILVYRFSLRFLTLHVQYKYTIYSTYLIYKTHFLYCFRSPLFLFLSIIYACFNGNYSSNASGKGLKHFLHNTIIIQY